MALYGNLLHYSKFSSTIEQIESLILRSISRYVTRQSRWFK